MNNEDLSETVARAQTGDEEAFRMLVEQCSRGVFSVAYRIVGNPADAEEAVQETFLRVFKRLDGFEARAQFGTWLHRVAANAALDVVRRRERHASRQSELDDASGVPLPLSVSTPGPGRLAQSGEISDRLGAAMQLLTPAERAAFTLRHVEGHSIREIGEALGLRANAVKNTIFRAVQKMRRELAPLAGEMT